MGFFSLKPAAKKIYDKFEEGVFQFPLWDFSRWNWVWAYLIVLFILLPFNSLYGIFLVETYIIALTGFPIGMSSFNSLYGIFLVETCFTSPSVNTKNNLSLSIPFMGFFSLKLSYRIRRGPLKRVFFQFPLWDFSRWNYIFGNFCGLRTLLSIPFMGFFSLKRMDNAAEKNKK